MSDEFLFWRKSVPAGANILKTVIRTNFVHRWLGAKLLSSNLKRWGNLHTRADGCWRYFQTQADCAVQTDCSPPCPPNWRRVAPPEELLPRGKRRPRYISDTCLTRGSVPGEWQKNSPLFSKFAERCFPLVPWRQGFGGKEPPAPKGGTKTERLAFTAYESGKRKGLL